MAGKLHAEKSYVRALVGERRALVGRPETPVAAPRMFRQFISLTPFSMNPRYILLPLVVGAILTGCKDDDEPETSAISGQEAAELVGATLAAENGGMTLVAQTIAEWDANNSPGKVAADCGETIVENIARVSGPFALSTFSWNYDFSFVYTCNSNVPQALGVTLNAGGQYDGPVYSSGGDISMNWNVTDLLSSSPTYQLSGGFTFQGNITNDLNSRAYTFTATVTLNQATFSKSTLLFTGGGGTVRLVGTAPAGSFDLNFSGSISADGQLMVTILGQPFSINLYTGAIS